MWWEQGGFLLVGGCPLIPPQVSLEPLSPGGGGGREAWVQEALLWV